MPILCTRALSVPQREEIRITYQLCCQAEPLTLSCPQDADIYWLLTDGSGAVLSLLAAWKTGEDLWECCGFTRPACRRNGYFSALLEEACKEGAPLEEADILFAADGHSPDAAKCLERLGAQAAGEEYLMECALLPFSRDPVSMDEPAHAKLSYSIPEPFSGRGLKLLLDPLQTEGEGLRTDAFSALLLDADGQALGSCLLSPSGFVVCLSSLLIREDLRGKGLGTRFLGFLFPALAKAGFSRITLQVSASNAPALALYRKTGFRVAETLSYYLY